MLNIENNAAVELWTKAFPFLEEVFDESENEYASSGLDTIFSFTPVDDDMELKQEAYITSAGVVVADSYTNSLLPSNVEQFIELIAPELELYDEEEFYDLTPWNVLGITDNSFERMVEEYYYFGLDETDFVKFFRAFNKNNVKDIDQRVKLSIINVKWPNIKVEKEKLLNFIKNMEQSDFEKKLMYLSDYTQMREEIIKYNNWVGYSDVIPERDKSSYFVDESLFPEYVKPSHIKDMHDKITRKLAECESTKAMFESKDLDADIRLITQTPQYQSLIYTDDNYAIVPVTCAQDLDDEGEALAHCVGEYKGRVATGKSNIYFLRERKDVNKSFMTLEVRYWGDKVYALTQCFGYDDSENESEEVRAFLKKWAKKNKLSVKCRI